MAICSSWDYMRTERITEGMQRDGLGKGTRLLRGIGKQKLSKTQGGENRQDSLRQVTIILFWATGRSGGGRCGRLRIGGRVGGKGEAKRGRERKRDRKKE